MSTDILLTVAIPTYNRPKQLEKIIQQLQKEENQNFILLIADDSSDNLTEMTVEKYKGKMKNLVYHKNKVNLGYSGNVCNLYDLAKTRYIWFLCDDDTVLLGAIDKIIRAVKKYIPTVALFNCTWVNSFGITAEAGVREDKVYNELQKFTDYNVLCRATFLSIIVIEKRALIDAIKQQNYKDNIFFQLTLILSLLSDNFSLVEVSEKILHRNVGYKYGEFFKFYLVDMLKAVHINKHKFDNDKFVWWSKRHLLTALELYISQKIGLFKYNGNPTKDTIRYIKKYYGFYSLVVLLFKPIYLLIPTFLLKSVYFLYLVRLQGVHKAKSVYIANINRAYKDARDTGFTTYR